LQQFNLIFLLGESFLLLRENLALFNQLSLNSLHLANQVVIAFVHYLQLPPDMDVRRLRQFLLVNPALELLLG
jgi:hypothetical protein